MRHETGWKDAEIPENVGIDLKDCDCLEMSVVESSHVAAENCFSQLVAFASQSVLG